MKSGEWMMKVGVFLANLSPRLTQLYFLSYLFGCYLSDIWKWCLGGKIWSVRRDQIQMVSSFVFSRRLQFLKYCIRKNILVFEKQSYFCVSRCLNSKSYHPHKTLTTYLLKEKRHKLLESHLLGRRRRQLSFLYSFTLKLQRKMSTTKSEKPPVQENEDAPKTANQLKNEAKKLAKLEKFNKKQQKEKTAKNEVIYICVLIFIQLFICNNIK